MTKRVKLNEVPYEGIEVGEKVMFLTTSYRRTSINFGFYRGLYGLTPVVEFFFREMKWHLNKDRGRYEQDEFWSITSKRVFLTRQRIYGLNSIKESMDLIPTYNDIARMIERLPMSLRTR